jgi:hypothetical protein
MRKRWCHDHKIGISDNWKRGRDMVRRIVLHFIPYIRMNLRSENIQGNLQSGMPGSNTESRGRFCDGLGSNIVVQPSIGSILTLYGRITAREYVRRLGNQVHPTISEKQCSFPRRQRRNSHSWNCSVMVWRAWKWTSASSLASTFTTYDHHWTTPVSSETSVRNRFLPPTPLKQLEDVLQEEWYKIPLQIVQNLYESIPRRTAAVLKAKRGPLPC